jgi:predicted MPP superfamily phosphohydrolase
MLRLLLAVPVIAIMLSVVASAHFYLFQRLVVDPGLGPESTAIFQWLLVACGASLVLQPIAERTLPHRVGRFVAWPASLWMGFGFLMLVATGFSEFLSLLVGSSAEAAVAGADAPPAELGFARVRAALVVGVTGAAGALGLRNGFSDPLHERVEIVLPRWPRALDGFRIVQISDIHIGPILDRRFARRITNRVNALEPDLVAVTGDLVDGSVARLIDEVAPFSDLRGRLGVFFVTGNHDHYSGGNAWADQAAQLGMRVLRNERVSVEAAAGVWFELAGVDDHHSGMLPGEGGEDLDKALHSAPEDRALVLLAHDPSTFKRASKLGGVDLQLSGHTHGGQIWPFNLLVRLAVPFVAGLYRRGESQLYVSRGTGFWGPPMRLRAAAEIGEIILRSPES